MTRNLFVILNGKRAGQTPVRVALAKLRAQGVTLQVRVTEKSGDAARFAADGLAAVPPGEAWTFVAGGGDGTVNQVATGLHNALARAEAAPRPPAAKTPAASLTASAATGVAASTAASAKKPAKAPQPRLAILPLGTANDFAAALRLPLNRPEKALQLAVEGQSHPLDLGRAIDLEQGSAHIFVNMATGGFGARMTATTDRTLKHHLGRAAYLLTGLARFAELYAQRVRVSLPGGKSWQGDLLALALGNGSQAGGGLVLCPLAKVNDGLLEVVWLRDIPFEEQFGALISLGASGLKGLERHAEAHRLAWLQVESDRPIHINLDGEPYRARRFRFDVLPGRLRIVGAKRLLL